MHGYTSSEFNVYVHDDVDCGRAVTAAAMLLLLQGGPGRRFMSTSSPSWPPALGQSRGVTSVAVRLAALWCSVNTSYKPGDKGCRIR